MPSISSPVLFLNYEEAVKALNLPEDMYVFKISDDSRSLDCIAQGGQVIYKVGIGLMKGPSHPAGNQMYYRQRPILCSLEKYGKVPVMRFDKYGTIEYLGMYTYNDLKIGMSFEGFKYYIFKMHRQPNINRCEI